MSDRKVCLDMFSGLGGTEKTEHGFSAAFQESEQWDVYTIDIEPEYNPDLQADVAELSIGDILELIGEYDTLVVLCGHPCTLFSTAGNHNQWDGKEPVGDRAKRHVALLYHSLGLIKALSPAYWYLENPRASRIQWFIGRPEATVTYCRYGMDYQKPTGLWGNHAPGMTYKSCPRGANCHTSNTETDGTSAVASMPTEYGERAVFPRELSDSILEAVEQSLAGDAHEQGVLQAYE